MATGEDAKKQTEAFANIVANILLLWVTRPCTMCLILLNATLLGGLGFAMLAYPLEYCCGQTRPVECEGVMQSVCAYTGRPYGILYVLNVTTTWVEEMVPQDITEMVQECVYYP